MYIKVFTVFGSLAVTGCMVTPMDNDSEQMSLALSSARDETSRHADLCERADTTNDAAREFGRHEQAMSGIMDRMDRAMGVAHEMHRSGSRMESMMGTLSTMRSAVADHGSRLRAKENVTDSHAECVRYRDEMLQLCAFARQDNDTMGCM